jgi:hypothetical protein
VAVVLLNVHVPALVTSLAVEPTFSKEPLTDRVMVLVVVAMFTPLNSYCRKRIRPMRSREHGHIAR